MVRSDLVPNAQTSDTSLPPRRNGFEIPVKDDWH